MSIRMHQAVTVTKANLTGWVRACLAQRGLGDTSRLSNDLDVLSGRRKSLIHKRKTGRRPARLDNRLPHTPVRVPAGGCVCVCRGAHTRTRRINVDVLDILKKIDIYQQLTTSRYASRCNERLDVADKTDAEVELDLQDIKSKMPLTYKYITDTAARIGKAAYTQVRRGCRGQENCFFAFENGLVKGCGVNDRATMMQVVEMMVTVGVKQGCVLVEPAATKGAS